MSGYLLDTSAVAKLYHQEDGTAFMERVLLQGSVPLFLSRLSLLEIESVIAIKTRTGELDAAGREIFRRRLRADLSQGRMVVGPPVRESEFRLARALLIRFGAELGLRTLDAIQLAIALQLRETIGLSALITADKRLCGVAAACGCPAIDPIDPGPAVAIVL